MAVTPRSKGNEVQRHAGSKASLKVTTHDFCSVTVWAHMNPVTSPLLANHQNLQETWPQTSVISCSSPSVHLTNQNIKKTVAPVVNSLDVFCFSFVLLIVVYTSTTKTTIYVSFAHQQETMPQCFVGLAFRSRRTISKAQGVGLFYITKNTKRCCLALAFPIAKKTNEQL